MNKELKQAIINTIKQSKIEVLTEPKNVHNKTYTCRNENNMPVMVIKYADAIHGLKQHYKVTINIKETNVANVNGRTPARDMEQADILEIMRVLHNQCQKTK